MEKVEVRDTRNGEWYWVYSAVIADPHLSLADKVVYSALSTFGGYQVIRPSIGEIANRGKTSERATRDSLRNLEKLEYLKIELGGGRNNCNIYYLLKKPKGCKLCPLSERGQITTLKGANGSIKGANPAPDIDIYKDNKDRPDSETESLPKGNSDEKELEYVSTDEDGNEIRAKKSRDKRPPQICSWYARQVERLGEKNADAYIKGGFFIIKETLKKYPEEEIKKMLEYHLENNAPKFWHIGNALSGKSIVKYLNQ